MAENDQDNDEYKFVDMDNMDTNLIDEENPIEQPTVAGGAVDGGAPKTDTKRNAISAVIVVICIMVGYKVISHLFFGEKSKPAAMQNEVSPPTPLVQAPPVTQPSVNPVVSQPVLPAVNNTPNADLTKKVSAIEVAQDSVRAEVGSVNQQVSAVNNNVSALSSQIENLNQMITNLSSQLAKQSEEINTLMIRTQPKPVVKVTKKYLNRPPTYHLQAVIPGRAWLIAANGSTLTVREGTTVGGYGVVKLIDPMQGRVITSSGRIIKFSQEDS